MRGRAGRAGHRAGWRAVLAVALALAGALAAAGSPARQAAGGRRVPPGLAAAQARAELHGHVRAEQPWQHDAPSGQQQQQQRWQHSGSVPATGDRGGAAAALHADQQHRQQRRQLLRAAGQHGREGEGGGDSADAEPAATGDPPSPFANLPVGTANATGAREAALRSALLEGYDASSFPWSEYGPANVSVNLALHKILGVDLYGGTMRMVVWLRQEWNDPRLSWNKTQWNVSTIWFANSQQGDTEIWQPDIVLWNAANPILYTLAQEPLRADSTGRMYWTRPGVLEVACNFRGLSAYPFGRTHCEVELGSWVYGPWYVDVHLGGTGYALGGSVTSSESAVWTEYRIANVTARRHTYPPYPCCPDESDWPVAIIDVALERQNLIYIMKVILPQIILTAVAFTTFWLSPACGERLGLAVTIPLAVAVYDLLTFSQLPVSNKVTLVSAMGMTAFLFSMAVLMENALVIQLWHYREHELFRGLSVLAATAISYREQLVWVGVLGVISQLKTELVQRQLAVLQKNRTRKPSFKLDSNDKLFHSANALRDAGLRQRSHRASLPVSTAFSVTAGNQDCDVAGRCTDIATDARPKPRRPLTKMPSFPGAGYGGIRGTALLPPPGFAGSTHSGDDSVQGARSLLAGVPVQAMSARMRARARWRHAAQRVVSELRAAAAALSSNAVAAEDGHLLARARAHMMHRLEAAEAELGVQRAQGALGGTAIEGLLLTAATKEQLRQHLTSIIEAEGDPALQRMQRRIRKALAVFGEDVLVTRLHATLAGGDSAEGAHNGGEVNASTQDLRERLAIDFNRRWQLLAQMIDYVCRYTFISAYVVSMLLLIVTLTQADT